jgi:hypothetical protein
MSYLPCWKWVFIFGPGVLFLAATLAYYFKWGKEEGEE